MRRFLVAVLAILAGAGLTIAGAPESQGQVTAAPPVVVTAPCPSGTSAVGKKCVKFKQCPSGQHAEGETCKPCPPNYRLVNRSCEKVQIHTNSGVKCSLAEQLANKCGKDGQLKASDFAPKKCPPGQHPADSKTCVKDEPLKASDFVPACPAGQHWAGKKGCVKN